MIYSANAIESLHARMRRATRARGHIPQRAGRPQVPLPCRAQPRPDRPRRRAVDEPLEASPQRVRRPIRGTAVPNRSMTTASASHTVSWTVPVQAAIKQPRRHRTGQGSDRRRHRVQRRRSLRASPTAVSARERETARHRCSPRSQCPDGPPLSAEEGPSIPSGQRHRAAGRCPPHRLLVLSGG